MRGVSAERTRRNAELFASRIDRSGGPDACWPWLGVLNRGYGRFGALRVHVAMYEAERGPVPAGKQLDHLCHTADLACPGGDTCLHRRCANPAHLEAVTPRVNSLRGRGPAAINAAKTACRNGHPFTEENTYFEARSGDRGCRACNRAAAARYRARVAA